MYVCMYQGEKCRKCVARGALNGKAIFQEFICSHGNPIRSPERNVGIRFKTSCASDLVAQVT